jgi:nitroreductase
MDFDEVVVKRRSIRKFADTFVSPDLILKILDAGRWAPSAGNSQPWRFVVVRSDEVKSRIAEACTTSSKKAWAAFSPERAKYLAERGGTWDKSYMKHVPVLIAVCCEIPEKISEELALASVWMSIENVLLAATASGLGACVYTVYDSEEEAALKEILQAPKQHPLAAMIQLGYANDHVPSPSRKSIEDIMTYEHF